jgi:ferritin-like metal-binding protein YciE
VTANSLQELYVEHLQDLYSAEQQIIKALPKMIEAAQSEELRNALNEHLEVTRTQASRIETICEELGEDPENEKCKGMEGVLKEGSDLVKEMSEPVRDAAIIAAAQPVEHYEMAGYGTARTYASLLGYDEAASLLEQTLEEEKEADQTLSGLAEELNVEALEAGGQGTGEEAKHATGRGSGRRNQALAASALPNVASPEWLRGTSGPQGSPAPNEQNTADTVWTG